MSPATRSLPRRPGSGAPAVRLAGVVLAAAATLVGVGAVGQAERAAAVTVTAQAAGPPSVRVSGNQLIDGGGHPIRLIGVDHSGSESACVDGEGFFDPPDADTPAMIAAMSSWHVDAVRVPLNEDCWLGINLPYPSLGGAAYRAAIVHYVGDLNAAGLDVILDLHWSAPGSETALGGQVMADEDHSPSFWLSVAGTFKGDQGVVFDLYNEPRYLPFACIVQGNCVENGSRSPATTS